MTELRTETQETISSTVKETVMSETQTFMQEQGMMMMTQMIHASEAKADEARAAEAAEAEARGPRGMSEDQERMLMSHGEVLGELRKNIKVMGERVMVTETDIEELKARLEEVALAGREAQEKGNEDIDALREEMRAEFALAISSLQSVKEDGGMDPEQFALLEASAQKHLIAIKAEVRDARLRLEECGRDHGRRLEIHEGNAKALKDSLEALWWRSARWALIDPENTANTKEVNAILEKKANAHELQRLGNQSSELSRVVSELFAHTHKMQ
jgi:hypothetical protein